MITADIPEGLTFDDVLLLSRLVPTFCLTKLTRPLNSRATSALQIPLCSAAMDTVTEAALAIALAQQGGIGVIHKNLSIERQAEEVDKVKRSESGMIVDPVTIRPDRPVREALQVMERFTSAACRSSMKTVTSSASSPIAICVLKRGSTFRFRK